MPECKNHLVFLKKSSVSVVTSAIASTDHSSAASIVSVRIVKPRATKSNASKNADSSGLERRLAELTPGCNLSLQRSQPCGALMAGKWSNGPGIQRRVNWRDGLGVPERERHDEKRAEMSRGLTRRFCPIKYKHKANLKHQFNRTGSNMYTYVADEAGAVEGFEKEGSSHECVLAR